MFAGYSAKQNQAIAAGTGAAMIASAVGTWLIIRAVRKAARSPASTTLRGALHRVKSPPPFSRKEATAAIVEEATEWTPAERRALIASLSRVPDYEEADPLANFAEVR
jgi:hypothetical protein